MNTDTIAGNRRGLIRFVGSALFITSLGLLGLLRGWEGWMSGEILIRPKRGQAYLAVATGPDAGAFLFEVWSHLLVGGTLSIGGLAALLILFLAPRERLAKVLVHVGRMSPTAGSPRVPAWLVVVALIALPSLFIYIA